MGLSGGEATGWGGAAGKAAHDTLPKHEPYQPLPPSRTDSNDLPHYYPSPTPAVERPPYWPFDSQQEYDAHQAKVKAAGGPDRYYFHIYSPLEQGKLVAKWNTGPIFDAVADWFSTRRFLTRLSMRLSCSIPAYLATLGLGWPLFLSLAVAATALFSCEILFWLSRSLTMGVVALSYATVRVLWLTTKWIAIATFWCAIGSAVLGLIYFLYVVITR